MTEEITLGKQVFKLPYADLLPSLSEDEYNALRTDIIARGIVVPVVIDEQGGVIDGQHRLRIAASLGLADVPFEIRRNLTETEREALALDLNLHRRHLSQEQQREVIKRVVKATPEHSDSLIAEQLGVDDHTVKSVRSELVAGSEIPNLDYRKGKDGKSYPAKQKPKQSRSKKVRAESVKEVTRTLELLPGIDETAKVEDSKDVVRAAKKNTQRDRIAEIAKGNDPLDTHGATYPVIYADPPWSYDFAQSGDRAIENHYPTMTLDDICALPVSDIAAPACALFLWATSPKLPEAIRVVQAWGFTYKTCMVWVKDQIGMGYYARQKHELLLIATRGDIPPPEEANRPPSVIEAPRLEHSAKPVEFYEAIERMYPTLAKLEMFSRTPRNGWQAWGNQTGEATTHDAKVA